MSIENIQEFNCPYCAAVASIAIEETAGRRQNFITDCEVCCRPIEIEVDIDSDGYINFIAKREGEG